jgi:UDP-glucose:(heptosyl)LPS alpha-1,3-glucosyltransferase
VIAPPIEVPEGGNGNSVQLRRRLGLDERQHLVLFVGHDFERKGLDDAITAVAAASPEAHLAVVGRGNELRYRAVADRCGAGDRIHFLGVTSEPHRYFGDADVFILPTREEVWGTTVIEAMAAGVPVITTGVAGVAVEVERSGAGLVVENGSTTGLKDALVSLLETPARREEMGKRGPGAARRYGQAAHARAMIDIYTRVVDQRRRTKGAP